MIHDLRNPISSLIGAIELLELVPPDNEDEYNEIFSTAKNCGEMITVLIGNILDFAKLEAQKIDLDLKET